MSIKRNQEQKEHSHRREINALDNIIECQTSWEKKKILKIALEFTKKYKDNHDENVTEHNMKKVSLDEW